MTSVDDREKGEDLSYWKSTKGIASWKFLSFKETRELHNQIRQEELHGEPTDQHIVNGNVDVEYTGNYETKLDM